MVDLSGTNLGSYVVLSKLGQGGMGAVYKAHQASMGRDVALKVLPAAMALDPAFLDRFRREARVIASLGHARILPVFDFGEEGGQAYLVMRYLDGPTLRERILREGALPPAEAARIIRQVAEGLTYAHGRGVIHRDITSNNIMLDSAGDAYITDFGLSKIMGDSASLTGSAIVGTPEYISPEQATGDPVGPQADIYSLGVVLFEMLTGKVPFTGASAMVVIVKHINEDIPAPSTVNPALSPALDAVVLKATVKDPGDRYQDCMEFAAALDAAVRAGSGAVPRRGPRPARAAPKTPTSPSQPTLPRWAILAGVVAIIVLVIALIAAIVMMQTGRETTESTATAPVPPQAAQVATSAVAGSPPPSVQPSPNPAVLTCDTGLQLVIGYDFGAGGQDGLKLFRPDSTEGLTIQQNALLAGPKSQQQDYHFDLSRPIAKPAVLLRVAWPNDPGTLWINFNDNPQQRNRYSLMIDIQRQEVSLHRGEPILGRGSIPADLFDHQPHDIFVSNQDGALLARIDGKIIVQTIDPQPLAAGFVSFRPEFNPVTMSKVGVCGSPEAGPP